jgi:hypothetical protein
MILTTKSDFSWNNIKRIAFTKEDVDVYCPVRYEFLICIHVSKFLHYFMYEKLLQHVSAGVFRHPQEKHNT